MFTIRLLQSLLVCLLVLMDARADIVAYRGRLTMDGVPYHGAGQFRFAIVGSEGAVTWSTGNVDLLVRDGVYSVRLGDPAADMSPLPGELLRNNSSLRIWVRDRAGAWAQAGGDIPLKAATNAPAETLSPSQATAILAELRELRARLDEKQKPPAETRPPQFVTVPIGNGPVFGNADAPLVLVEFTEFASGPSSVYAADIFPGLFSGYVETGKIRIASRQMPQQPTSEPAARAAVCAHDQGKFLEVRSNLFALGPNLTTETITRAVRDAGLDMAKFDTAFSGKEVVELVQADLRDARALGISQAPAFVLGRAESGRVTGILLSGIISHATWEAEIYKLLTTPAAAPKKP